MPTSGSRFFTDADDYQASLAGLYDLLVLRPAEFRARLTWVDLPNLRLLRAHESSSRIAYVSLPSDKVFITFPTHRDTTLVCNGVDVRFGDICFHSLGERLHQRTTAAGRWGAVSLLPASLLTYGRTIAGEDLVPPTTGRILRPSLADRQQLLALHAQAGRIAEKNPVPIEHPQVARALEQDMIWALATCLAASSAQNDQHVAHNQVEIMARFEAALAAHPSPLPHMSEICGAIGVSQRTLAICCARFLGMSPGRYQRLRRLKLARAELLHSSSAPPRSDEMPQRFGFADLRHFVMDYTRAYGKPPFP